MEDSTEHYEVAESINQIDLMIISGEVDQYWLEEVKCSLRGMERHLKELVERLENEK